VRFPDSALEASRQRLSAWWAEQDPPKSPGLKAFNLDGERWMEDPEAALFHVAVAAALFFRMPPAQAQVAFQALERSGALEALHAGLLPEGPLELDVQALMWASVVARRCAEHPDLAADLERAKEAAEAFKLLDAALGRGLFNIELFWILRLLSSMGSLRLPGSEALTALPRRGVRDTLFRLGFLENPYAADTAALLKASAAARAALPQVLAADEALEAFGQAAGCCYGCPQKKRCDLPCRERSDLS